MFHMITNSLWAISSENLICAKAREYSRCLKVACCKYFAIYYKKSIKKFFAVLLLNSKEYYCVRIVFHTLR